MLKSSLRISSSVSSASGVRARKRGNSECGKSLLPVYGSLASGRPAVSISGSGLPRGAALAGQFTKARPPTQNTGRFFGRGGAGLDAGQAPRCDRQPRRATISPAGSRGQRCDGWPNPSLVGPIPPPAAVIAAAFLAIARLAHFDGAALQIVAIELLDGLLRFGI